MSGSVRCLRVCIHGHVQGVFFRQEACEQARQLGIRGWVRNTPDGTVEALICGDEAALAEMRAWLSHGPPYARVQRIDSEDVASSDCPEGFSIRY